MASNSNEQRRKTTVEHVTETVNKALGTLGCSYCRKYKPADQVRRKRTKLGLVKLICTSCDQARQPPRTDSK